MGTHDVVWVTDLDLTTCWSLLARARLGRIGFVDGEDAGILPVNHVVDDHTIALRTDHDSALGRLPAGRRVVFEVDDGDEAAETGWSVVVHGTLQEIGGEEERQRLAAIGLRPWAPGPKDRHLRIVADRVTGRSISRRRRRDDGTFLPYMPPD